MLLIAIQLAVTLMGLLSIYKAAINALFFMRTKQRIASSMVRMLMEQCVSSLGTLMFSINSLTVMLQGKESPFWNNLNPYVCNLIRFVMFAMMLHSTDHLSKSVKEIIARENSQHERN